MNIYITPNNEASLREHASKDKSYSMSGLVNELLHEYFEKGAAPVESVKDVKLPEDVYDTRKTILPNRVPNPLARFKAFCKVHGVPLTLEGKCLQKGCEYA